MISFEEAAWQSRAGCLAGIDEAGRGPLAGPVVAGAVSMDREGLIGAASSFLEGLTDSKKLTERKREHFFEILSSHPEVRVGIGEASVEEIDRLNILVATHLAMQRAWAALKPVPDFVLIDGLPVPGFPCDSEAIVKGDSKSLLIAAASVIAKVSRDHQMVQMDKDYPGYGFARHKGYGTRQHMQALMELGPCPTHRRSFRPVREAGRTRDYNLRSKGKGAV